MIGHATGTDEVLESKRNGRKVGVTSSRETSEFHEEDFEPEYTIMKKKSTFQTSDEN